MDPARFDHLSRLLVNPAVSRRAAIARLTGAVLATLGLAARHMPVGAQDATPPPEALDADAQALLSALDPDTRDSLARALWSTELRAADLSPEVLASLLDAKNSNAAFGHRMQMRLLDLAIWPPSFVPGDEERFATLYPLAASLSPHQAYAMTNLLGGETVLGYTPIPAQAGFVFPQRNAMDLGSQVGWYFFVGSCTGDDGAEYGIEMMFFRYALLPPPLAATFNLNDVENQVMELHLAISKAGDRHYRAKPIVVAGTSGLMSFATDGLGATMGKNVIRSLQPDSLFPFQVQAWGQDNGGAEPVDLAIDITIASGGEYLLQGSDGCAPCCDGVGTLYYSIPNLQPDLAASTLTLAGKTVALTSGVFWFDHQWGMLSGTPQSAVLRAANNLTPAAPGGWDWFEAQFVGDRQITCAAIHSNGFREFYFQTGLTPPGTMQVPVNGKYMDEAGVTHAVQGTLDVTAWLLNGQSPAPAEYPPTHTWYPNRWEFQFGADVPEDIRAFTMEPIVATGQAGFFANGGQYSEGAVYLRNAAGDDIGRGFAESVYYANALAEQLRLAGVPVTDDMLTLFGANPPSEALVLVSEAYVALNEGELEQVIGTCLGL